MRQNRLAPKFDILCWDARCGRSIGFADYFLPRLLAVANACSCESGRSVQSDKALHVVFVAQSLLIGRLGLCGFKKGAQILIEPGYLLR